MDNGVFGDYYRRICHERNLQLVPKDEDEIQLFIRDGFVGNAINNAIETGDVDSMLQVHVFGRAYILNDEGSDVTYKYNGRNWTFEDGKVYCLDIGEAAFFLNKALADGVNLVETTRDDWFSSGDGVAQTFYW